MAPKATITPKAVEAILDRIAGGESLMAILRENGMPGYSTFISHLSKDEELQDKYRRAREASGDADADKVGDIADKAARGEIDPNAARVAIDAYKWAAGKRKPKVYGDKLDLSGRIGLTVVLDSDADKL